MRLLLALAIAVSLAAAGCLSTPSGAEAVESGEGEAVPWSVEYTCGPGHDRPLEGGGCFGRIEGGSRALGEPQVALHRGDPLTFAIAVSEVKRPDALAVDLPDAVPRGIGVYVTQDGGASFTRHAIDLSTVGDLVYNPAAMGADPAVAFTPDGALHLAGLILTRPLPQSPGAFETTLFTMRSADLGQTWEPAVVLDDVGYNDREWLAASPDGEVVLTWRDHSLGHSKLARGSFGISESTAEVAMETCQQVSNPAWIDGVPLVGCQEDGDLVVYELTDEPTPRGTAADACPSNSARITATPQGALVGTCYFGTVAVSPDGGRNWPGVFDVFEKTTLDDDWDAGIGPNIFAVGSDGSGMVHLTLTRFPVQQDQQPNGDGRPVAHVVLDPRTGDLVHERELQSESSGPGPMGYAFADDFYGIDFVGGRGIMVWTASDWSTHFALLDAPA